MSNGIKAQVVEQDHNYHVVITMMLNDKDTTWVEFDDEQLTNVIKLLKSQRRILRKCLNDSTFPVGTINE